MSSLRLASRDLATDAENVVVAALWVSVTSPLQAQQQPHAPGVVLSLAAARQRYRAGIERGVDIDIDALPQHGSGDSALAADIERSVDEHWDD